MARKNPRILHTPAAAAPADLPAGHKIIPFTLYWAGIYIVAFSLMFTYKTGVVSGAGVGYLFGMSLLPCALCWMFGNKASPAWSFWKVGAVYSAILAGGMVLGSVGQLPSLF